jgi:hypothetical protein
VIFLGFLLSNFNPSPGFHPRYPQSPRLQVGRVHIEKSSGECLCARAGKLKDLGNTVLGKFGMSLDNFKAEKDPETGSYSINFKQ